MKRKYFVNGCFAIVIFLFSYGLTQKVHLTAKAATSGPTPYTVKIRQAIFDAQGKQLALNTTMTVAVRTDGSRSIVHSQVRTGGTEVTRTVHLSSGSLVSVGELWDIKTTWYRPRPDITQWYRDPSKNCTISLGGKPIRTRGDEMYLGEEIVGGFRSAKIVHGSNAEWFALDVGCALLQAKYDFGNSVNTHNLISLIPGEPDATFFHVSDTFKEVTPSEFNNIRVQKLNLPCDIACSEAENADDLRYLKSNASKPI